MKYLKIILVFSLLIFGLQIFAQQNSNILETNSSKIIKLANATIDLYNDYKGEYKHYVNLLNDSEQKYRILQNSFDPQIKIYFNTTAHYSSELRKNYEIALKEMSASAKERVEIAIAVENAYGVYAHLEMWDKKMRSYFENKEFANDKLKNYPILKDSLQYYFKKTRLAWKNVSEKATEAIDNAELQLMRGDPIVSFLLPMKTDLRLLKNVSEEYSLLSEEDCKDFLVLIKDIKVLQTSLKKNMIITDKDTTILLSVDYYTSFYSELEKCADSFLLLAEELSKTSPRSDVVSIQSQNIEMYYAEILNIYNDFMEYGID